MTYKLCPLFWRLIMTSLQRHFSLTFELQIDIFISMGRQYWELGYRSETK